MAVATHSSTKTEPAAMARPRVPTFVSPPSRPRSPWLFLATEVFSPRLIGSYIVLRALALAHRLQQSLSTGDAARAGEPQGVLLKSAGGGTARSNILHTGGGSPKNKPRRWSITGTSWPQ